VPPFAEYVSSHRLERDSVLAVIQDGAAEPVPYLDQIAGVALVCMEPVDGEVAKAFEVNGYPLFFLLDADGAVVDSGFDPAMLPEPAAV